MSRHFMREANLLKAPLKPTWTSFMIQTRQELLYMTESVNIIAGWWPARAASVDEPQW
jgi:hypothetical protein